MTTPRKIAVLGSTGSIGRAALEVISAHPGRFEISALAAGRNVALLAEQIGKFNPAKVVVYSVVEAEQLQRLDLYPELEILHGQEGLEEVAVDGTNDMVLNAVVGADGLRASLAAVRSGKDLALANKESLVVGGPLFESEVKKSGAKILPIDSEHSAIWQCLKAGREEEVKRIWLTASGGPFRDRPAETFNKITVEEALNHPTWKMGPKITIDSATMVNKGLELIEAVWLFSLPPDRVRIVIHPQSIVHSMVEFIDSSIIAQLSRPDMKLPIAYALFWPDRLESDNGLLDITEAGQLDFLEPDEKKFPALALARLAAEKGGTAPAVFNAANEAAVAAFLEGRIQFTRITELIEKAVVKHIVESSPTLDDILNYDRQVRVETEFLIGNN